MQKKMILKLWCMKWMFWLALKSTRALCHLSESAVSEVSRSRSTYIATIHYITISYIYIYSYTSMWLVFKVSHQNMVVFLVTEAPVTPVMM